MSILDALWQVESSNIPGRRGPKTKYGQPLGIGQTLPGTAREMAQKLGLPWRPDLLTSPTEEGAAYQKAVSQAYYDQGMERTGNTRDALRYYHGGPNRQLWGPKTNAYADKVMGLAGGDMNYPRPQFGGGPNPDGTMSFSGAPSSVMDPLPSGSIPSEPQGLAGILQSDPAKQMQNGHGAFGHGGKGWVLAGIIADALAGLGGGRGGFAPTYLAEQENNRNLDLWREKVAAERADHLAEAQYKHDNPDPTNAARMAAEAGFVPGTPAFQHAMQRYMERPIVINGQAFGYGEEAPSGASDTRSVVRTGTDASGRRVVQYNDGTVDYAD